MGDHNDSLDIDVTFLSSLAATPNSNSTFIALNLHLLADFKVHNARNQRL